jgi:hypothetical protein
MRVDVNLIHRSHRVSNDLVVGTHHHYLSIILERSTQYLLLLIALRVWSPGISQRSRGDYQVTLYRVYLSFNTESHFPWCIRHVNQVNRKQTRLIITAVAFMTF